VKGIRETFHHRLDQLSQDLVRIGSLVDEAIEQGMRALTTRDLTLARQVITNDRVINAMRYQVEEQAYALLATQQPMARDLRQIVAAISIATNMERMGDHAAGIAQLAIRIGEAPLVKPPNDLLHMAEAARRMFRQSLDAYLAGDPVLARSVVDQDDELDLLHRQVLEELIHVMVEDPSTVTSATYLLWVAHNLERLGDRTTNICERIIYVATGELADLDASYDELETGSVHDD